MHSFLKKGTFCTQRTHGVLINASAQVLAGHIFWNTSSTPNYLKSTQITKVIPSVISKKTFTSNSDNGFIVDDLHLSNLSIEQFIDMAFQGLKESPPEASMIETIKKKLAEHGIVNIKDLNSSKIDLQSLGLDSQVVHKILVCLKAIESKRVIQIHSNIEPAYWRSPLYPRQRFLFYSPHNWYRSIHEHREFFSWYSLETPLKKQHGRINLPRRSTVKNILGVKTEAPKNGNVFTEDFAFSKFTHTLKINSTSLVEFQRIHQLRKYFDLLGEKLGIQKLDDWYQISHLEALECGAGIYLAEFENSLIKALIAIYSEHPWKPWKFENIAKGSILSSDLSSHQKNLEDDYELYGTRSSDHKKDSTKKPPFRKPKSFADPSGEHRPKPAFHSPSSECMPDYQISLLHRRVQELFPGNNVYSHFVHPKVLYPGFSRQPVEYQVFIPSLKIAFEYSTIERSNIWGYQDHLNTQKELLTKKELSKKLGVTLIEIPFYWDTKASSLKKIIQSHKLPVFNSEDVEKREKFGKRAIYMDELEYEQKVEKFLRKLDSTLQKMEEQEMKFSESIDGDITNEKP